MGLKAWSTTAQSLFSFGYWAKPGHDFLILWTSLSSEAYPFPGCHQDAAFWPPSQKTQISFPFLHLSVPERLTPRLLLLFYQTLIKLCLSSLLSPFLNPFMDEKQRTQERSPSYLVTPEVECCPTCGSAQSRPSSNTPTPNCPITDVNEDEAENQKALHRMIVSVRVSPAVWDPLDTGAACCDSAQFIPGNCPQRLPDLLVYDTCPAGGSRVHFSQQSPVRLGMLLPSVRKASASIPSVTKNKRKKKKNS